MKGRADGMRSLKLLSGALAPVWLAFRWLVPAPGLWRRAEAPVWLIAVRAVALAAAFGGWRGLETEAFASLPAPAAACWTAGFAVLVAMQVTLIQVMVQDAMHGV